jgi:hypothetical protein
VYFNLPDMSTGKVGRPAQPIVYVDVYHDDKNYVVGIINPEISDTPVTFVIDKELETYVTGKSWHKCNVNYIASTAKRSICNRVQVGRYSVEIDKFQVKNASAEV